MTLIASQPKPKKCQNPECGTMFVRSAWAARLLTSLRLGHQGQARQAGAEGHRGPRAAEIKVRKERLKTHSDHIKDAEKAVRDYRRTYELSIGSGCISCGKSQAEVLANKAGRLEVHSTQGISSARGQGPSTAWSHPTYGFNARPVTRAQASTPGRGLPFPRASVRA